MMEMETSVGDILMEIYDKRRSVTTGVYYHVDKVNTEQGPEEPDMRHDLALLSTVQPVFL